MSRGTACEDREFGPQSFEGGRDLVQEGSSGREGAETDDPRFLGDDGAGQSGTIPRLQGSIEHVHPQSPLAEMSPEG